MVDLSGQAPGLEFSATILYSMCLFTSWSILLVLNRKAQPKVEDEWF